MEIIELADFEKLLRGSAGLIIGPGQTAFPGVYSSLAKALAEKFGVLNQGTFLEIGDSLVASGTTEEQIRAFIQDATREWVPSPTLNQIATARWAAVISAAMDSFFENKLQKEAVKHPSRRDVDMVTHFGSPRQPRTVPVFKLLGCQARGDFPTTFTEYISRRSTWRRVVPDFASMAKGSPILCLGMSDAEWVLLDLLAEMRSDRTSLPGSLLFLADDPLVNNHKLTSLLRGHVRVHGVRGGMNHLLQLLDKSASRSLTMPLPFPEPDNGFASLSQFTDIVTVVNDHLAPQAKSEERLLLTDMLFSPTMSRWDPYYYSLDFRRNITEHAKHDILELQASSPNDDIAYILLGSAASGKTTVLKRLAYDFASKGALVLWQRPSYLPDSNGYLRQLFEEIGKLSKQGSEGHIYYFMDDPVSAGTVSPDAVLRAARAKSIPIVLVVAARSSDWMLRDYSDSVSGFSVVRREYLTDSLDDDEWDRLPEYLVRLGVSDSIDDAQGKCNTSPAKTTKDTLSFLYWLLPQTRSSITHSVRDQFFRLGDLAGLKKIVVGTAEHSPQMLQDAYAMAAVADFYRAPLPLEILVGALGIDYGSWMEAMRGDGPVWGILYAEDSESGTVMFRTRNSLVTDVLMETMNGGTVSHAGEFRYLTRLIAGGHGKSSSIYRDFYVRLLVTGDRKDRLDYDEGLHLFDLAIKSLPYPDRTLVHHKGLWIKNKGNDPLGASEVLKEALNTPVFPYTDKGEINQHIHTSLAATALDAIDQGKLSLQEGRSVVVGHLAHARTSDSSDAKAVHVHANLAVRLVEKLKDSPADTFSVVSKALSDIDQSLLLLRNPVSPTANPQQQIEPLEEVRGKLIMSMKGFDDINVEAEKVWQAYRSQDGFVVAARKLLEAARQSGKGAAYKKAYDYCVRARNTVEKADHPVSSQLAEVHLQIYWYWLVVRTTASSFSGGPDWEIIKSLAQETLQGGERAKIPMNRFMLAVAYAHLGEWEHALAQFGQLRQLSLPTNPMWRSRAVLLSEDGGPRKIQGTVKQGPFRNILHIEELHVDVYCERRGQWPRDGEKTHAFVEFAFQGPIATKDLD